MSELESIINDAWENRDSVNTDSAGGEIGQAVEQAIALLDSGKERVAEPKGVGDWQVNEWLKKAVLLSFRLRDNAPIEAGGFTRFYDKVPSKFGDMSANEFQASGVRVVPPAMARKGVGIGGVLEPLQASPTIIEDNCFIGARSEVVEGVVVEEGSVISMGVYIGQSTRIYDRERDEVRLAE